MIHFLVGKLYNITLLLKNLTVSDVHALVMHMVIGQSEIS